MLLQQIIPNYYRDDLIFILLHQNITHNFLDDYFLL